MCGIAGTIGLAEHLAVPAALAMRQALRHRGPDGEGVQTISHYGSAAPTVFAHTRLAILDPTEAGRQPMTATTSEGPPLWLTYNGEIYNFRELRNDLAKLGLHASSGTDTEIILLAYRAWGPTAIDRLRGMFAFALVDGAECRVILARDRLGIKPLYVYRSDSGGILFASEVRALLATGPALVPRRISPPAIESFLSQGAVYGDGAHISGVQLLEPGTVLTTDLAGNIVGSRRYWSLNVGTATAKASRPEAVARLGHLLRDAVRRHLVSDVPIGLFLSGGIDSAALATLAVETSESPVRTVSIGFDRKHFDESTAAERTAGELGTDHRTIQVSAADILTHFDDVLAAVDQPTVDGFNTYFVSRAAREAGVKVALSGVGGDELFGGYASFRDVPRAQKWLSNLPTSSVAAAAIQRGASLFGSRGLLKFGGAIERPHDIAQLYLLRRELFLRNERRRIAPLPAGCDPWSGLTNSTLAALRAETRTDDVENAVSALELCGYMRNMLLRDADVFSMAHGLEIRVPLLDHEFVEVAVGLPGCWKRRNDVPKALLVDAVGPKLPRHVIHGPKRGFTFPWSDWLRDDLAETAAARLNDATTWSAVGFDATGVAELWRRFVRNDPAVGGLQILALLVLADVVRRQRLSL
ncbi:MAG: asparagine synthase (glutamine-hydrolyzing) [Planctomycetaceae bacterium]|nr:asparagine synthase (glutamine-hydrolyzing) [Planctomycetaceae bacterium]